MRNVINLLFVSIIGWNFLATETFADWAYSFVVYDGNVYIISKTHLGPKQIDKKIGKVTKYSDMEGTYSGNFSNKYAKGTEYYEIKGVKTNVAIAVKENKGIYIKANYDGKYAGSRYSWEDFLPYLLGVILLIGVAYFIKRNFKSKLK